MVLTGFDWDDGNRNKCRRHGVSIEEIEYALLHAPRFAPDFEHSKVEDRFIAVGRNIDRRAIFVAFTIRGRDGNWLIRPVSARYMHKKESNAYEKSDPPLENR